MCRTRKYTIRKTNNRPCKKRENYWIATFRSLFFLSLREPERCVVIPFLKDEIAFRPGGSAGADASLAMTFQVIDLSLLRTSGRPRCHRRPAISYSPMKPRQRLPALLLSVRSYPQCNVRSAYRLCNTGMTISPE